MTPRLQRPSTILCSLALLLALHPLSGSALANGEGLAGLIKAMICGCESCVDEVPSAAVSETSESDSCCTEPSSSSETRDDCACGHPAEVPLPAPTPFSEAPKCGSTGTAQELVSHQAELSATTLSPLQHLTELVSVHAPPGWQDGVEGSGASALRLGDQASARLAVLCVAQV